MNKKTIVYVLLLAVIIGASVGYYQWHKPHEKVEDAKGLAVTAAQLSKDFAADEAKANTVYSGKALEVSGTVSEVKKNQDGKPVIILSSDSPDLSVQCTMRDAGATATQGQTIKIKGFFASNDMFGPTLTDCVIIN